MSSFVRLFFRSLPSDSSSPRPRYDSASNPGIPRKEETRCDTPRSLGKDRSRNSNKVLENLFSEATRARGLSPFERSALADRAPAAFPPATRRRRRPRRRQRYRDPKIEHDYQVRHRTSPFLRRCRPVHATRLAIYYDEQRLEPPKEREHRGSQSPPGNVPSTIIDTVLRACSSVSLSLAPDPRYLAPRSNFHLFFLVRLPVPPD